jgi:broad specificity phosphatase PhoE
VKLILIRHGQSEANVDPKVFDTTPDHEIPLTERGKQQASEVVIGNLPFNAIFYTSPYLRTRQTSEIIQQTYRYRESRESVLLREQEFGPSPIKHVSDQEKAHRLEFGKMYYRFPQGESGADVFARVALFVNNLRSKYDDNQVFVVVCHEIVIRMFVLLHEECNHEQLEDRNFANCSITELEF